MSETITVYTHPDCTYSDALKEELNDLAVDFEEVNLALHPSEWEKLEELTDETCRWPIGHPYEEKFYFCGRKPMAKFPYCKLHVLYAFQPKNAKEEDIITEEDLPVYEKKIKSA